METRLLGNTDMEITRIGFGSWAIGGGDWDFGWGSQDDQEAIDAIKKAVDLGMNWIDTAAVYGLGHSEELVGQALKGMSNKPFVFTKCSMNWDEQREIRRSLKAGDVRQECENSLRRLGVDAIDLYQIHWPNPEGEIEEGWAEMAKLKEEGKVRFIGVSNFNVAQMQRISKIAPISSLQPPYSLIRRDIEKEILPYCLQNNIGVIVYSPMASGMLTGTMTRERIAEMPDDDWRKNSDDFKEPKLSKNLALADQLTQIGEQHYAAAGEVAIAWTLLNPAVTAAIVGGRSADQVAGIIQAADLQLSEGETSAISG